MAINTMMVEEDNSRNFLNPFTLGSLSHGQEHFFSSPFTLDIYWEILRNIVGFCELCLKIEKKKEEGQQGMRDSNSQHAVLETAALPIELIPFYLALFSADREKGLPTLGWATALSFGRELVT